MDGGVVWGVSRKFWSGKNFGPAGHFLIKLVRPEVIFLWKMVLVEKRSVTCYGYPRAVANTETAVSLESDDNHHEEYEFIRV